MKIRQIVTYILSAVSFVSIYLASGIKQVANWWDIARPFFIVWLLSLTLALLISNWNFVRRITYPTIVCVSAWAYRHKILKTKFGRNTYKVYKTQGKSYRKLFDYTQVLFDIYIEGLESSN
jgi:hypothetical protein